MLISQALLVVMLDGEQFKFLSLQIPHFLLFRHLTYWLSCSGLWLIPCFSPLHESITLLQYLLNFLLFIRVVKERRLVDFCIATVVILITEDRGLCCCEQTLKPGLFICERLLAKVDLFRHLIDIWCVKQLPDVDTLSCAGLLAKQMPCLGWESTTIMIVVLLLVRVVVVLESVHHFKFLNFKLNN